jgi:protein-S-isoprenylcysteine O-methyltransferase Ste14
MPIWIKTLLFTILVPGTATVGVPYLLLLHAPAWSSFNLGPLRYGGVAPVIAGALGYLWCAWEFTFTGRGTPAPLDPPKVFVATGLYRVVRNPMYVSVLLVLLGEALLFESWALLAYALVFWGCAHLFVLYYEEPTLKKKFGLSYENYLLAIPRWLPKL